MTQREFGDYVGIDASYICNAERNGVLYKNHAKRIAEKFEMNDEGVSLLSEVVEARTVA